MWEIPGDVLIGGGVGQTDVGSLLAFDLALLDAGVGNLNLMRVTSVFPPGATLHYLNDPLAHLAIPRPGTLTPCVYSKMEGREGDAIACSIAVARPKDPTKNGMIFETCGYGAPGRYIKSAMDQAVAAMYAHGIEVGEVTYVEAHMVIEKEYGAVVCVAMLLPIWEGHTR